MIDASTRIAVLAGLLALSMNSFAALISDFDDGTLQGWVPDTGNFGGLLEHDPLGNPGGAMRAIDTGPSGVSLLVRGPEAYRGNLTGYSGVSWDEYVYDYGASNSFSTGFILRGGDGTEYMAGFETGTDREIWRHRFLDFQDPSIWTLRTGSASFFEVLLDVEYLLIGLDTSSRIDGVLESKVDNIELHLSNVPVPASLLLFGSGLIGLVGASRRRRAA